jgi:hypothetical protein
MGYDMARMMENLPDLKLSDELKIADSIFIRPQIIVVFDSLFDCALICAPEHCVTKPPGGIIGSPPFRTIFWRWPRRAVLSPSCASALP